ncbi:MAG: hypothetical protein GY828_00890 [Candidatus Gracilibacteria bacterium]|nr:hypothetical protein [Candidatus Gracilibacteria bacterium]
MSETPDILSQVYSAEIETDTNDKIKDKLIKSIHETHDILRYFKNEYGEESHEYQKIIQEYQELKKITITAVQSEQNITISELKNIEKELKNITDSESFLAKKQREVTEFFDDSKENTKYLNTIRRIEWSKSDEKTENKIHGILTESQHYLNGAKGTEFFDDLSDIYSEIDDYINETLDNDKKIDFGEINNIEKKYFELLQFVEENKIQKDGLSLGFIEKQRKRRENDHLQEKENTLLKGKDINDSWSKKELNTALNLLQNNNKDGAFEGGKVNAALSYLEIVSSTNTIFDIDSTQEANIFQEKIIGKILGSKNGYNKESIQGFRSKDGGNIIMSITDFEAEINGNNIQSLNRFGLVNYLKSIDSDQMFNVLKNKFGIKKSNELKKLITEDGAFKNEFNDRGVLSLLETIKNSASNFVNDIFSGNIIELINKSNDNDREGILDMLKVSTLQQQELFKKSLVNELGLNENEAIKLMEKLINTSSIDEALILLTQNGAKNKNILTLTKNVENLKNQKAKKELVELELKKLTGGLTPEEKELLKNQKRIIQDTKDNSEILEEISSEDLMKIAVNIENGGTFEENIKILRRDNIGLDQVLQEHELERRERVHTKIKEIDDPGSHSITYENFSVNTDGELNYISSINNSEKIEITNKEAKTIKDNPEALKNLIDTKEKLDILGLDFVWKYREKFIPIIKTTPGFEDVKMDITDDFINPIEFDNLLKYIITLLGKEPSNSYSGNISKIINISQVSALDDKKNSITKYGNIGTIFNKMGYIGESSIDTKNITNMQNYKESILKYNTKKETTS